MSLTKRDLHRAVLTVRESGTTDFQTDYGGDVNVLFRSYDHRNRLPEDDLNAGSEYNPRSLHNAKLTIHTACSCTTAAPTYFKSVRTRGRRYIDGGVWANNPAAVAWAEAIFMAMPHGEAPKLHLSIGTGKQIAAASRVKLRGLVKYAFHHLTSTDKQEEHASFYASPAFQRRDQYGHVWPQYFRFDVPHDARHKGLHKIGLAACKRKRTRGNRQDRGMSPLPPQVQDERDDEKIRLRSEAALMDRESMNPGGFDPATYTYTTFDKIRDRTIAWLYADGNGGAVQAEVTRCAELLWQRSSIRRNTNSQRWADFRTHPDPKHRPQPTEQP